MTRSINTRKYERWIATLTPKFVQTKFLYGQQSLVSQQPFPAELQLSLVSALARPENRRADAIKFWSFMIGIRWDWASNGTFYRFLGTLSWSVWLFLSLEWRKASWWRDPGRTAHSNRLNQSKGSPAPVISTTQTWYGAYHIATATFVLRDPKKD